MRCASSARFAQFSAVFGFLTLAGCASDGDAVEKRLSKMHEEVTRLQNDTDRMAERMDAMEMRQKDAPRSDERVARAEPTSLLRPKLKVVRVEADGEQSAAAASEPELDEGPRVLIQGEGKALESRTLPGSIKSPAKSQSLPAKTQPSGKTAEPK
jgi:outer membrane murein-binding lipoprotein Lpp